MGGSPAPRGRTASVKPGRGEPGAQSRGASCALARADAHDSGAPDQSSPAPDTQHDFAQGSLTVDRPCNHAHDCTIIDGQRDHARRDHAQHPGGVEVATPVDIVERLGKIQQEMDHTDIVMHDRRTRANELRGRIAALKSELAEVERQAADAKALLKHLAESQYQLRRALADRFFAGIRQDPNRSVDAVLAVFVGGPPGLPRDLVLKVIGSYRSRRTQVDIREDARRHYLERVPIAIIAEAHGISHQCVRESVRRYARAHPEEFTAPAAPTDHGPDAQ